MPIQKLPMFMSVSRLKITWKQRKFWIVYENLNYEILDLTDNEMAKLHVRHMVGGHAPGAKNERVFRFIFPEKPGALLNFLTKMGENWNISMFHYRNHGADFGRILIGIQIPPEENDDFLEFLDEIGYDYTNETDNPAYKLFLG